MPPKPGPGIYAGWKVIYMDIYQGRRRWGWTPALTFEIGKPDPPRFPYGEYKGDDPDDE